VCGAVHSSQKDGEDGDSNAVVELRNEGWVE
jgi:hypothetical protein